MESAWLWTVALGAGWLDTRTDPSPPSKFPQKASSASLYLEAAFFFYFNALMGCTSTQFLSTLYIITPWMSLSTFLRL